VLRPKKAKELIPQIASDLGFPEELVKDVVFFYWEEIRKNLKSLTHSKIHIENLGDFNLKYWKLEKRIESLNKAIENNNQKGLEVLNDRYKIKESIEMLSSLKLLLEEEKQKKDFISLHKKITNESKRKHNTDMEEQGGNT